MSEDIASFLETIQARHQGTTGPVIDRQYQAAQENWGRGPILDKGAVRGNLTTPHQTPRRKKDDIEF